MNCENSNVKIEVNEKQKQKVLIHEDPEVYTIDDLLTPDECAHFINISKDQLQQSLVADENNSKGKVSQGRTSTNTWIKHDRDPITFTIAKKIADIVGMPLENAESFQVVYYKVSQEYRNHYDSWLQNYSEKTLRYMHKGGARLKTAIVYLNTVEEGGETKMTKLNKSIDAVQGRLLVFNNTLKDSHERHPLSEHAGMPVHKGEKYIFNLWFRECNRWKLYSEFNPKYYENVNLPTPPTPPNTPSSNVSSQCKKKCQQISQSSVTPVKNVIHPQFHLEKGDYIPFTTLHYMNGNKKELYNYVDDNEFLFIYVKNIEQIKAPVKVPNFNVIIVFKEGTPISEIKGMSTKDDIMYGLFNESDKVIAYFATPNRKIYKITEHDDIDDLLKEKIEKSMIVSSKVPYLFIEDVFSPQLLKKVLDYYDANSERHTPHYTPTKNRLHIHPCKNLEIEIDNKLSRSVFPEIRKVFYFDVNYRENYKICCYDAETGGRFHPHRDTPAPYQHRRYAMSLFLNDDYEGGEFELPEYNFKIKPKANSALVFPGISSHKVNQVTKGQRRVIITFYCSEIEGKTKDNSLYTVKSHFFKQHGVKYGPIFPV